MSANATNVVGYFNPHDWPISLEISELNLRLVLNPKQYITDGVGQYFNDPVFEPYCYPKGLSKTEANSQVPIRFVPRVVRSERPAHSVTQATSFVRDSQGVTVPVYNAAPAIINPETPINKNPVMGMTVETARRLGYAGKPRLVPEDYGLTDGQGAPPDKNLPPIKVSIESPPRIRTAAPLTPQVAEALNDPQLTIQERQARAGLQHSLTAANRSVSGDNFDPASVRPTGIIGAVPLRAPDNPAMIVGGNAIAAPVAVPPQPAPKAKAPPRGKSKKVAEVVEQAPPQAAPVTGIAGATPLEDSAGPDPVLESPPAEEPDKRFVCGADGRPFRHRSELLRYVKAKYPTMVEDLMAAYPPDPQAQQ